MILSLYLDLLLLLFVSYKENGLSAREAQDKIYQKIQKEDLTILIRLLRMSSGNNEGNNNNNNTTTNTENSTNNNDESFEERLVTNAKFSVNLHRNKHALKFICCVDGSDGSDVAFKTTMRLWKRHDHVIIFHAINENRQNELPPMYRAGNIKQKYEGQVIERGIPSNQAVFQFEKKGAYNTFTVLQHYLTLFKYTWETSGIATHLQLDDPTSQYMSLIPPDFIIIGYTGRTIKSHPNLTSTNQSTISDHTTTTTVATTLLTMGSTTNITFRSLHIPCIICKKQIPYSLTSSQSINHRTFSRPLSYIMAIDNTIHSKNGLEILLQLIRSCDSLKLIHVIMNNNENTIHEDEDQTNENEGNEGNEGKGGENDDDDCDEINTTQSITSNATSNTNSNSNNTSSVGNGMSKYLILQRKYERFLLDRGPKHTEVLLLPISSLTHLSNGDENLKLTELMTRYVNHENPDFFAIAPRTQHSLTSLTEYLINHVQSSIVLCKY